MASKPKLLVLAGTKEARELIEELSSLPDYEVVASLAGVTKTPRPLAAPTRVGGFGGVSGMLDYLTSQKIAAVIDATHPYAAQISQNAAIATTQLNLPLLRLQRALWQPMPDDNWHPVDSVKEAVDFLPAGSAVFFAASPKVAAPLRARPDIHWIIRSLNRPEHADRLPNATYIEGGPAQNWDAEAALFKEKQIQWIISKNSGGISSFAKIKAARELKLPVVMIRPPAHSGGICCSSSAQVLRELHSFLSFNIL